jgi:hydroxymethylpyrimidine/phosphomethylpyrimidine kinase
MAAERGSVARTPRVLTIAGSDSGGGAGLQADLKAFARCGVHGMTAVTAITAQSTAGVTAIQPVSPDIVLAQVRAVVGDIGVDAVKVGMLGTAQVTLAVARALEELPAGTPVVVDPVMVAESGARLLEPDAQRALVEEILPRASVLTPNLPEARVLTGLALDASSLAPSSGEAGAVTHAHALATPEHASSSSSSSSSSSAPVSRAEAQEDLEAVTLARAVLTLGPHIVVLTGGHRARTVDLFLDSAGDGRILEIPGERHPDGAAHGSGCTHSAVLAAQLALGSSPIEAARTARALTGEAIANGLRDIGEGSGPVDVIGLLQMRGTWT